MKAGADIAKIPYKVLRVMDNMN